MKIPNEWQHYIQNIPSTSTTEVVNIQKCSEKYKAKKKACKFSLHGSKNVHRPNALKLLWAGQEETF